MCAYTVYQKMGSKYFGEIFFYFPVYISLVWFWNFVNYYMKKNIIFSMWRVP